MSAVATWSTKAAPLAGAAGATVFALGIFCVTQAAITLALGPAAWNLPAWCCLVLSACWAAWRLRRMRTGLPLELTWDASQHCFLLSSVPQALRLVQAWQGPFWLCLALQPENGNAAVVRVVVWKSAVSPPLWSQLSLRIQACLLRAGDYQNKENP